MRPSRLPSRPIGRRGALAACLFLVVLGATGGARAGSAWAPGEKSRARLIAAGGLDNGRYRVGVEIDLARNFLTYWRTPGEAGAPPIFHFENSRNLADTRISYPAPTRYIEAGSTAYGYQGRVVFPLDVTPNDPARPVTLAIDLQYAVCEKICIPAEARMTLELRPDAPPAGEGALIEAFAQRVPNVIGANDTRPFSLWGVAGAAHPTWRVKLNGQVTADADLFAEGPEGWYFDTRPSGDGAFDVILAGKPADAALPVEGVRLTITKGDESLEALIRLDGTPGKP